MNEVVVVHLVVKTQVNAAVREICGRKGFKVRSVDAGFMPSLDRKVVQLIEDALGRAAANNRRTLMGRDV